MPPSAPPAGTVVFSSWLCVGSIEGAAQPGALKGCQIVTSLGQPSKDPEKNRENVAPVQLIAEKKLHVKIDGRFHSRRRATRFRTPAAK
jgi:hypothetical protein